MFKNIEARTFFFSRHTQTDGGLDNAIEKDRTCDNTPNSHTCNADELGNDLAAVTSDQTSDTIFRGKNTNGEGAPNTVHQVNRNGRNWIIDLQLLKQKRAINHDDTTDTAN